MVEFISSARSSARTFYRQNAMKYHYSAWAVTRRDAHRMWLGLRGTSSSMLVNGREESIHEQQRPVGRQQRGMVLLVSFNPKVLFRQSSTDTRPSQYQSKAMRTTT